jgi:hypothetical protein
VEATEAVSSNLASLWERPMDQSRSTGLASISSFPDSRPLPKKSLATGSTRRFQAFLISAPFRRRVWQPGWLEGFKLSWFPRPSEEEFGNRVGSNGSNHPDIRTLPKKGLVVWLTRCLDRPLYSSRSSPKKTSFPAHKADPCEVGPECNPCKAACLP